MKKDHLYPFVTNTAFTPFGFTVAIHADSSWNYVYLTHSLKELVSFPLRWNVQMVVQCDHWENAECGWKWMVACSHSISLYLAYLKELNVCIARAISRTLTVGEAPVFFGGGYVSLKDWYRLATEQLWYLSGIHWFFVPDNLGILSLRRLCFLPRLGFIFIVFNIAVWVSSLAFGREGRKVRTCEPPLGPQPIRMWSLLRSRWGRSGGRRGYTWMMVLGFATLMVWTCGPGHWFIVNMREKSYLCYV